MNQQDYGCEKRAITYNVLNLCNFLLLKQDYEVLKV